MAEAILSVLDRPPDRERLIARATEVSVDRAVDQYLEVFAGLWPKGEPLSADDGGVPEAGSNVKSRIKSSV